MKKVLKSSLSIFLAITIIFSSAVVGLGEIDFGSIFSVEAVAAYSGTCGNNLTWTLNDEGTLTISGTGDMPNYSSGSNAPWYSSQTNIKSVVIESGITSIGDYAFSWCKSLTSITIPESVTSIGDYAFSWCTSLTSITIPDSVTSIGDETFCGCTNFVSIEIPDSVTSIGNAAFSDCTSLTSVIIGDSVTSIGYAAFSDCTSLTSVTIGDSVTSIGSDAFNNCTSLTSVTIPDRVTSIGSGAFSNCTSLTLINVDSKNTYYTSVDGVLFDKDKTTLVRYPEGKTKTSYVIPNSVTSIGYSAFHNCISLTSITIPDSITSIGGYAFNNCTSLTSVYITDIVAWCNIGFIYDFSNPLQYAKNLYLNDALITELVIPEGVTSIGAYSFYGCTSLTSITIPDSVTSIGAYAFYGCTGLTSINIPDSVTSMGNTTFYNCTSLTSVIIGDSVTRIGNAAFSDCTNLTSVIIGDSVTSIGDRAFCSCTGVEKIYWNAKNVSDFTGFSNVFDSAGTSGSGIEIVFGDTVEKIPAYLFYSRNSFEGPKVTSVTIGKNVTGIGEYAFYNCTGLNEVITPCNSYASTYFDESKLKLTHTSSSDWIVDENATCTKNGSMHGTCIVCGNSATSVIPAGHTESDWITDKNATCTEDGSEYKACTVCGEVLETATIAKTTHKASDWITDKKATVNAAGKKHKECTVCGEILETATIKQLKCSAPKITAIANKSYGVRFEWSKVSGADSYIVYRKVSGGSYKYLGKTTKTAYADKTAKSGTKYYYVVKAVNEAGNSEKSASKGITFVGAPVIKTPTTAKSGITVKWGKVGGADGYIVYRKTGSGSYEKLAKVKGGTKVSYLDKTAKKGKTYSYKVFAYKGSTKSAGSAVKTIKDKY